MEEEFEACVRDLVSTIQGLGGLPVVQPGLSDEQIDAAFADFIPSTITLDVAPAMNLKPPVKTLDVSVRLPLELRVLYRTFGGVRPEDRPRGLAISDFGPCDFLFPTPEDLARRWQEWEEFISDGPPDDIPDDILWWRGWYPVFGSYNPNSFLLINCRGGGTGDPLEVALCTAFEGLNGPQAPETQKIMSLQALLETWLLWAKTGNIRIEDGEWRIGENLHWTTTRMGLH